MADIKTFKTGDVSSAYWSLNAPVANQVIAIFSNMITEHEIF